MAWVRIHKKGGDNIPDGNDIEYPIISPSFANKAYKESDINAIAIAIGETDLTVSEIPAAIAANKGGMVATNITLVITDCIITQ